MSIDELLGIRSRERSDLLDQVVKGLRNDQRVRAAWLSGSVSRGDDDALSDLDLSIVVSDESVSDFVQDRRLHAAQPASPVLLMDNFRNAPPGGAYLLALYPGEAGPQHVDWFWRPESESRLPDDEKILFDHVGLPIMPGDEWRREAHRPPGPPLGPNPPLADVLTQKIAFFWAMSLIVAKYIARRNGETVARMTSLIATTLTEAAQLGNVEVALARSQEAMAAGLETAPASEQFAVLDRLAWDARMLGDQLVEQGAVLPSEAIPQIHQFFELTKGMIARHS